MKYKVKAAVLRSFRSPFSIEDLELEAPDDWVIVDVKYVGICGRDLVVWKGGFTNLRPPLILGHEIFGFYKDKPVGVFPGILKKSCEKKTSSCEGYQILGEHVPGGYSDKVAVPRENIVKLPDEELEKYASAMCGVATMIHVARVLGIKPGDRVLVTGASGGVGIHGIQYLTLIGAEVYAFTRSEDKAKKLRELDVNVVTSLDFYKNSERVDHVVEIVGAKTINDSMRALKFKGSLALVGNVTGEPIIIKRPALLVMRELNITGSAAYSIKEYETALKIIGKGFIKPFYKIYSFNDINLAYRDVVNSKVLGRAVLKF